MGVEGIGRGGKAVRVDSPYHISGHLEGKKLENFEAEEESTDRIRERWFQTLGI